MMNLVDKLNEAGLDISERAQDRHAHDLACLLGDAADAIGDLTAERDAALAAKEDPDA